MTKQLTFTPELQKELNSERYHHPSPIVQRRMEVLWLKSHELPHKQIAQLAGVCENTMREHFALYEEKGIEGLKMLNYQGQPSELNEQSATLEAHFRAKPMQSLKEAQAEIEKVTGIKRSESQVRVFLHKLGLRCRKVGMIPAKADPAQQADYLKQTIEPRLQEAKAGKRAVYYVDAAHFVLAPFLGFLWSFARIFIPAPAGRQRFNVLAALNAISHELVMVTNDSYIDSQSVCQLLAQLAALPATLPITLLLDNARYQRCRLVIQTAAALNIELCFLPPYSPNLNLIERLWKFTKKQVLYSHFYPDFKSFKAAISSCLAQSHTTYKNDLDSLLTLNFQSFEKTHFLPV